MGLCKTYCLVGDERFLKGVLDGILLMRALVCPIQACSCMSCMGFFREGWA